jgi:transposase
LPKTTGIFEHTKAAVPTLSKNDFKENLMKPIVSQLNNICETTAALKAETNKLASTLPEYEIVREMHGVGKVLALQLIAEIGDIRNFPKRSSLVRFAGLEPPENQSRLYNRHSPRISKQGSPHLRQALFQDMCCVLQLWHTDETVCIYYSITLHITIPL